MDGDWGICFKYGFHTGCLDMKSQLNSYQKSETLLRVRMTESQQGETAARAKLADQQESHITIQNRLHAAETQNTDFKQVNMK